MERTFAMIKPDGVQRGLIGQIITRIERRGLRLEALKMIRLDKDTAAEHYKEHVGKGFYDSLLDYITSGPVVVMAIYGDSSVSMIRDIVGKTDPKKAAPGTIRADFGIDISRNIIHAADSPESAERELNIYFDGSEYQNYSKPDEKWLYP